jgi:hypothetical protein
LPCNIRIYPIDIERYMKRMLFVGIEVLHSLGHNFSDTVLVYVVHGEALNSGLFERNVLVWVDVPDGYKYYVFWVEKGLGLEPRPIGQLRNGGDAGEVGQRHSVIVFTIVFTWVAAVRVGAVGMGVNPDYSEVGVGFADCTDCGRTD